MIFGASVIKIIVVLNLSAWEFRSLLLPPNTLPCQTFLLLGFREKAGLWQSCFYFLGCCDECQGGRSSSWEDLWRAWGENPTKILQIVGDFFRFRPVVSSEFSAQSSQSTLQSYQGFAKTFAQSARRAVRWGRIQLCVSMTIKPSSGCPWYRATTEGHLSQERRQEEDKGEECVCEYCRIEAERWMFTPELARPACPTSQPVMCKSHRPSVSIH